MQYTHDYNKQFLLQKNQVHITISGLYINSVSQMLVCVVISPAPRFVVISI